MAPGYNIEACFDYQWWLEDERFEDADFFVLGVQYTFEASHQYSYCDFLMVDINQEECAKSVPRITKADHIIDEDDEENTARSLYNDDDEKIVLLRRNQNW